MFDYKKITIICGKEITIINKNGIQNRFNTRICKFIRFDTDRLIFIFASTDLMILRMFRIQIMLTVVVQNLLLLLLYCSKWHFDIILFNKTNVCDKASWQLAYFLCRKNKCDTYFCTKFWRFHGYSLAMKSNNLMKMKVDLQISNFPTRKSQRKFVNICSEAWTRNLHRTT